MADETRRIEQIVVTLLAEKVALFVQLKEEIAKVQSQLEVLADLHQKFASGGESKYSDAEIRDLLRKHGIDLDEEIDDGEEKENP